MQKIIAVFLATGAVGVFVKVIVVLAVLIVAFVADAAGNDIVGVGEEGGEGVGGVVVGGGEFGRRRV